jgi:D-sedoheptulose 7-phosphate isomerase
MKKESVALLDRMYSQYRQLAACREEICEGINLLLECYGGGGKVLACGNGGSASDAEHIVGELMKGFNLRREIPAAVRSAIESLYPDEGSYIADRLQGALPAISLVSQNALLTAFSNDVASDLSYAQQVYGYGRKGDVLIAISTSGNSMNVVRAAQMARVMEMKTMGLTNAAGGRLAHLCDAAICVPAHATPDVQELHLPVYHAICAVVEIEMFG